MTPAVTPDKPIHRVPGSTLEDDLPALVSDPQKKPAHWQAKHCRFFQVAGIGVRVESDLDFDKIEFKPEFEPFAVDGPGDDNVVLRHYFRLPDLRGRDLGQELYHQAPWAISRKDGLWYYRGILPAGSETELHRFAVFSADHTRAAIYSPEFEAENILANGWHSLSLFPTDQIWLAPLLADRNAVLLHSAAAIINAQGLLFVGHSSAGKSTTVTLLKTAAENRKEPAALQVEILCDDRNILRRSETGWQVHGTWSHGDVADVSSASAPLCAILFLQQAAHNEIIPLTDRRQIWKRLLATLIRPAVTAEWWQKEMTVLEQIIAEVPFYVMNFDQSGAIVAELEKLSRENSRGANPNKQIPAINTHLAETP